MACPITIAKFVGTISLGLLTGLSYSVSNITIPALQALPTASTAANTLQDIQTRTRSRVLRFSNIAAISLITAFTLSSPRRKHPYLIWTSLVSLIGGGGLEFWINRRSNNSLLSWGCMTSCYRSAGERSYSAGSWVATRLGTSSDKGSDDGASFNGTGSEIEIVEESEARSERASAATTPGPEEADVNGETVQQDMNSERKIQKVRTWILGVGFSMGVVGIWGDGA